MNELERARVIGPLAPEPLTDIEFYLIDIQLELRNGLPKKFPLWPEGQEPETLAEFLATCQLVPWGGRGRMTPEQKARLIAWWQRFGPIWKELRTEVMADQKQQWRLRRLPGEEEEG